MSGIFTLEASCSCDIYKITIVMKTCKARKYTQILYNFKYLTYILYLKIFNLFIHSFINSTWFILIKTIQAYQIERLQ